MNALAKVSQYELAIQDSRERFEALAGTHLNYGDEEIFAMQMLTKNDYSFKIANANPRSVQLAMINVASTGLTLNPAMGYAYLVPRDNAIMLDISYKGLIKIATDTGSVSWVRAEVVHENDKFTYRGPAAMPEIVADPFRERGAIIGAYCIAKTVDGDILTEVMDMAAIEKIRSKSTAYTKGSDGRKGPWEDFPAEMFRKAVIKRARKTWPYTDRDGKLAKAVEIANQAEGGYVFEHEDQKPLPVVSGTPTSGVWESIPESDHERIRSITATVREYMDADDPTGALEYLDRQGLGAEEKTAVWTGLTAPMRAALKVTQKTLSELAKSAAA